VNNKAKLIISTSAVWLVLMIFVVHNSGPPPRHTRTVTKVQTVTVPGPTKTKTVVQPAALPVSCVSELAQLRSIDATLASADKHIGELDDAIQSSLEGNAEHLTTNQLNKLQGELWRHRDVFEDDVLKFYQQLKELQTTAVQCHKDGEAR
jgi:hypothetical protein